MNLMEKYLKKYREHLISDQLISDQPPCNITEEIMDYTIPPCRNEIIKDGEWQHSEEIERHEIEKSQKQGDLIDLHKLKSQKSEGIDLLKNIKVKPEILLIREKEQVSSIINYIYTSGTQQIFMDIETSGLDPFQDALLLLQIKASDNIFLMDVNTIGIGEELSNHYSGIERVLEDSSIVKVFHNAVFDLKFLKLQLFGNKSMRFRNIFDTMIAERLLTAGVSKKGDHSLQAVVKKYTEHELDKTPQTSFQKDNVLNDAQIQYAADDVRYLESIYLAQRRKLKENGLENVARLEFSIIPTVAAIEQRGMLLDFNQSEYMKKSLSERKVELEAQLRDLVNGKPINFNSPIQVEKVLAAFGHKVDSTAREVLEKIDHPFAKALVEHRKVSKLISSFLEPLPGHISPKTGRIHPDLFQCGTEVGRFTCRNPNLQQIPKAQAWRDLFVAPAGYKIITADYNQIELRILAEYSRDQALLKAYSTGQDLHQKTAAAVFAVPPDQVTKEQRNVAKAINFGLCYGMSPKGLARELNIPIDRAEQFIDAYFRSFPQVRNTLQRLGQKAVEDHYSETLSGRKRYYKPAVSFYEKRMIERQGRNAPIQGTCSDILKKAIMYLSESLISYDAHIVNLIHDEIVLEVREEQAERVKQIVECDMVRAGEDFLKSVPIKVEITIDHCWKKS